MLPNVVVTLVGNIRSNMRVNVIFAIFIKSHITCELYTFLDICIKLYRMKGTKIDERIFTMFRFLLTKIIYVQDFFWTMVYIFDDQNKIRQKY